jgi:thiol-disulfide isomerase/thioredoxin
MKLYNLIAVLVILLFAGCAEVSPPGVDLGSDFQEDTTYVTNVEAPQLKNILIEEFTGVSCPPCPSGHDVVKSIKAQYPDRIVVIAYHIFNFPQAEPIHGLSKQDFRTQDATDISNTIYGSVGSMPNAGIDRVPKNGVLLQGRAFWPTSVAEQIAKESPINIRLIRTFIQETNEVELTAKVSFTRNFDKKLSLNVAMIEDSIIDAQKNNLKTDTIYVHNYVLRDLVTSVFGTSFLDAFATKEAGRVYERKYAFKIDTSWNARKCKIVAFVATNEQTDKEVLQASSITLTE